MANDLSNPIFHDEDAARAWLEARVWPNGPVCPHCKAENHATLMKGKSHRAGLYQCNACLKPFTVTVGTLYESSKVPLHTWLAVTFLMMSSKKGMSALQISRMIGRPYKTVWFMCHRIRESFRNDAATPFGGPNTPVEADETFVGGKAKNRAFKEPAPKKAVLSLIDREKGQVRSFHVPNVTAKTLKPIIAKNVEAASVLMTDEAPVYSGIGKRFDAHHTVNHSANEYVRLGSYIHINTAESFFSIVKRGIIGSYHHVSEAHLHRYMLEFDYRYNTRSTRDFDRMAGSIPGIVGKRLMYRRAGEAGPL
ncbi:IS1595 family transposase [Methylocystis iwaonis]|uniref:DDE transposase n=1 Tax=Methylocystis iwaonis TaxID=2885079 RepID=A0ABN6VJ30_9HYPH|nr:IS1595 family transposase [Methylocystis iwaonis]BDV35683.1 DDE transposase [Methylocystis iwaonis]